ncbi:MULTISPECIES: hypothetical protein [Bacillus subtilis group]|uniref:hypothetical protein n=1 Tax=Bacillus subtilis group TaxID=653685 RepID=UPI000B009440|nr:MULTISPECIES: hypothetical protein [Bacillus subtilis group]MCY8784074.1 hypothetical protein [Bacillus spizizenii]MCY9080293.1 hypothetical protein [Bacillus inaquosorum]
MATELNISGVSPILLQHIKKWHLYRETDRDAIYTIELAVVIISVQLFLHSKTFQPLRYEIWKP